MTDATFEKVSRSSKALYGPVKIILCGFGPAAQPKFITFLKMLNMETIPLVWATTDQQDRNPGRFGNHARRQRLGERVRTSPSHYRQWDHGKSAPYVDGHCQKSRYEKRPLGCPDPHLGNLDVESAVERAAIRAKRDGPAESVFEKVVSPVGFCFLHEEYWLKQVMEPSDE